MPKQDEKGTSWRLRLARWFARISWRTRLLLAFVVLIISSASATIVIGNVILGSQILSLAQAKADSDLTIAWQQWTAKIEATRNILESVANIPTADINAADDNILRLSPGHTQFDMVSVIDAADMNSEPGGGEAAELIREAARSGQTIVSPVIITKEDVLKDAPGIVLKSRLEDFGVDGRIMVIACAAPIRDYDGRIIGVAFAGSVLNGDDDIVDRMVTAMRPKRPDLSLGVAATVFQGDRRIATAHLRFERGAASDYEIPLLSSAEERVTRRVLTEGGFYLGLSRVAGADYYTAYRPIVDWHDRRIGMVGIGSTVGEYQAAQSRTIGLFTTIIGAGMVFGVAMSWLFAGWLTRPLRKLAEGVSRVAEGDLNHKVRLGSRDELGSLARGFNAMVATVKERDRMLREATENRLSEVEKQISIGRLAAGVAHEINNPLTAILSLSSLMLRHVPPDDPRREDLEIIVAETTRCREIVSGLLDFARERPVAKKVIDLNEVARGTLGLVRNYPALEGVKIDARFFPGQLFVMADARQIQQVFTNIVLNAAEAIHDRRAQDASAPAEIRIDLDDDSSGAFAEARFRDSGVGIPANHLTRIFEPFFTTKGKSKGTGLGLSVSLGIVQKHNGFMRVDSTEGEGTVVTVTLPLMAIESHAVSFS